MLPEVKAGGQGHVERLRTRWMLGLAHRVSLLLDRSSLLAHDLARGLVEAHAEEGGMAQTAVGRPFHECDLCHELRLDPRRGAGNALLGLERRRLAHEWREPLGELAQRRAREARAHLAGVAEAVAVEVADEQRAEIGARPARRGEAADDELLRAGALELQPVPRAGGDVRRAAAL